MKKKLILLFTVCILLSISIGAQEQRLKSMMENSISHDPVNLQCEHFDNKEIRGICESQSSRCDTQENNSVCSAVSRSGGWISAVADFSNQSIFDISRDYNEDVEFSGEPGVEIIGTIPSIEREVDGFLGERKKTEAPERGAVWVLKNKDFDIPETTSITPCQTTEKVVQEDEALNVYVNDQYIGSEEISEYNVEEASEIEVKAEYEAAFVVERTKARYRNGSCNYFKEKEVVDFKDTDSKTFDVARQEESEINIAKKGNKALLSYKAGEYSSINIESDNTYVRINTASKEIIPKNVTGGKSILKAKMYSDGEIEHISDGANIIEQEKTRDTGILFLNLNENELSNCSITLENFIGSETGKCNIKSLKPVNLTFNTEKYIYNSSVETIGFNGSLKSNGEPLSNTSIDIEYGDQDFQVKTGPDGHFNGEIEPSYKALISATYIDPSLEYQPAKQQTTFVRLNLEAFRNSFIVLIMFSVFYGALLFIKKYVMEGKNTSQ